jgi:hypothetical protein
MRQAEKAWTKWSENILKDERNGGLRGEDGPESVHTDGYTGHVSNLPVIKPWQHTTPFSVI